MKSSRINSRQKGARGERQWRDELRANGYDARRGQQFSGSSESPDVVSKVLSWIHFEVKAVERLNIEDAIAQAIRDGAGKVPIVAHRRNRKGWLVTMPAEVFFEFLRGTLPPEASGSRVSTPHHPMTRSPSLGRSSDDLRLSAHSSRGSSAVVPSEAERDAALSERAALPHEFSAAACAAAINETNKEDTAVTSL